VHRQREELKTNKREDKVKKQSTPIAIEKFRTAETAIERNAEGNQGGDMAITKKQFDALPVGTRVQVMLPKISQTWINGTVVERGECRAVSISKASMNAALGGTGLCVLLGDYQVVPDKGTQIRLHPEVPS
jgi:hypothetical protein